MNSYDVIIIGAGPSGGQCARELAKANKKILLVERCKDFLTNNYSSGGAPNELMEIFELPNSILGTQWNRINIYSSNQKASWKSPQMEGVVLDFKKLRTFLAQEATKGTGELKLGCMYQKHEVHEKNIYVTLKSLKSQEVFTLQTAVLVDATGCERRILTKLNPSSHPTLTATGMEYLLEVPETIYQKWSHALSFFMGQRWMPQGYGWIFPMEANQLKVGMGRYFHNEIHVPHEKSFHYYLDILIEKCCEGTVPLILDKHGKTIIYTYRQKDLCFHGPIIGIGDAISSINPLALEGIRHAMMNGKIAAKHILNYLHGKNIAFEEYEKEIRNYYGYKWRLSEILMKILYKQPKDKRIDDIVKAFQGFTFNEILDLGFQYKLWPAFKFLFRYFIR